MSYLCKLQKFRIFDVLDTKPSITDNPNAYDAGRLKGNVIFENVSFSYDGRRQALEDISFSAKAGQTIALVGATGSGKSTTLSLLHRIFDPNMGTVKIDGVNIRDFTLLSLRRNIGVVFQEPMLFARTIEENLRIGNPDASDQEIASALSLRRRVNLFLIKAMAKRQRLENMAARSQAGRDSACQSPARF